MLNNKHLYRSKSITFLMDKKVILVLGFLLSVVSVAFFVFGDDWTNWFKVSAKLNSLVVMSIVFFLSFFMINKHFSYLSLSFVIPIVLICAAFFFGVLSILRLDYSVYYLTFSAGAIVSFFLLITGYIRRKKRNYKIAYIYSERTKNLPKISTVEWVEIAKKSSFDNFIFDALTADLRSNLSGKQEAFLAQVALKKVPVFHSARLIEMLSGKVSSDHMYENELGSLLPSKIYQFFKRIIDIALVLIGLPLVLPIMVLAALLIALESRGKIIFSQERIGQGGKRFIMYKLRSMYTGTEVDKTTSFIDNRITKVGRFIRKTRIDELPQLYNVFRGDMSLIGPRAEFYKFAEEYEKEIPFYSYRHIVKPGISGWAQVMQGYNFGVNDTKIKLEYDLYYIKNFSFSLDFLIFLKTIKTMLTGFGAR